ncbi:hypothetical protein, partial [Ilumatobacter sp.]|uniref:hypothetical protein n=1 Tax=Ilumatobacter sp. TaxID=1967498 RepID=UPI003C312F9B
VQYCTTDPDCEDTFAAWTNSQIGQAARRVAATLGLIFVGGWLFALGIELVVPRRVNSRFRTRFGPPLSGRVATDGGASGNPG